MIQAGSIVTDSHGEFYVVVGDGDNRYLTTLDGFGNIINDDVTEVPVKDLIRLLHELERERRRTAKGHGQIATNLLDGLRLATQVPDDDID